MTLEEAKTLKPGDIIIVNGLEHFWSKYNGKEFVVDNPTIANILGSYYIRIAEYVEDVNLVEICYCKLKTPNERGEYHECCCDIMVLMARGCQCGGC